MARSGISAALVSLVTVAIITKSEALTVIAPSEGMTVVADRPYIVDWTGADADSIYEIDLHYCGSYSYCFDDDEDCGFYIADLSGEGKDACATSADGCDVVMPEPLGGVSGDGYRVRISEVGTENARCSSEFYLVASEDAPGPGEMGGPTVVVVEPNSNSVAVAGDAYTIEFDYDNGFGDRTGRFVFDLYKAEGYMEAGGGDCGTWSDALCDKPTTGCRDTQGDYNVVVPSTTSAGMYKIRVGLFGDDSVFACSDSFEVMPTGTNYWAQP